jgi:hypothetical protein
VLCAAGCGSDIGEPEGGGHRDAMPHEVDATPGTVDAALPDAFTVIFGDTDDAHVPGVTVDTYLDSANPTLNYGSGPGFRIDADPSSVALLRFDVSVIIAPGSTVMSAELALTTSADALEEGSIQFFELTENWTEGAEVGVAGPANWTQRTTNTDWTAAGAGTGSRAVTAMTELAPTTPATRYPVALPIDLVQRWVDDPVSNNGIVLVPVNAATHGIDFESSESATTAARPTLTITAIP